jgi:hypothetical protein
MFMCLIIFFTYFIIAKIHYDYNVLVYYDKDVEIIKKKYPTGYVPKADIEGLNVAYFFNSACFFITVPLFFLSNFSSKIAKKLARGKLK